MERERQMQLSPLTNLTVPWGGQQFELQQVDFGSGARLMRLRIREGRRFTVIDLDAATVRDLARTMADWADAELRASG